ncbi:hypothetical protein CR513_23625, partial [Mucuna pruriens]
MLVIKLLGKNIGYNVMKDKLREIWRINGGFDIMDVDNGVYMIKINLSKGKYKVTLEDHR